MISVNKKFEKFEENVNKRVRKVLQRFHYIKKYFSKKVWEIGFSGGKDSTLLLHLFFEFIKEIPVEEIPKTYIVYTDVLVDYPPLRKNTMKTIENIKRYIRKFDNKVQFIILLPKKDFFSAILEDEYPLPHYRFRWCMNWMKLAPLREFLNSIEDYIMITGERKEESIIRKIYMKKRAEKVRKNFFVQKANGKYIFAPIYDWKTEEVLYFLQTRKPPWGGSYKKLVKLYLEKPIIPRFGCWVCTVVKNEKMLDPNNPYDKKVLHFKKKLISIFENAKKIEGKRIVDEETKKKIKLLIKEIWKEEPSLLEGYMEYLEFKAKLAKWLDISFQHLHVQK